MWRQFYFFALCLVIGTNGKEVGYQKALEDVLNILDGSQYDSNIRPSNGSGPIVATLQMYFREVDVDDIKMQTTVDMTFRMLWKDTRLAYTAPGVDYVTLLDPYKAWLPDPFFKGSISTDRLETIHPETFIRVSPDGNMICSTRMRVVMNCPMDFHNFPHDTQYCNIKVASYGYTEADLMFVLSDNPLEVNDNLFTQRFIMDEDPTWNDCRSQTKTGSYSCKSFTLRFKRQTGIFVMEIYIPIAMLVFISFLSEFLPPQQILGRLLMTLVPLMTLTGVCTFYFSTLTAVPYTRAIDVWAGNSGIAVFLTLIRLLLIYIRTPAKEPETMENEAASNAEDGQVKDISSKAAESPAGKILGQFLQHASVVSGVLILIYYGLFIIIYAAVFTGGD